MPFGQYKNFADCVTKNKSKSNPKAYCATIQRKAEGKKEIKFFTSNIKLKEEGETFHSEGFIATTHPDRDVDEAYGTEGDILSENAIDKIVDTLNDPKGSGHPEATQVSYRHDWLKQDNPELPAAGINTTAEKKQTEDGHWGVYVDTEHTSTFPDKDKLVYEVEKKIIPGYSIEYTATDFDKISMNGKEYRFIKDLDFNSYGFANGRKIANPQAEISAFGYKEMIDSFSNDSKQNKKVNKMETKEEKKPAEEAPTEEKKDAQEDTKETKEETEEKKEEPKAEKKVGDKEIKEFKEFQDFKTRKAEADAKIAKEVKELKEKKKPMIPDKKKIDNKEVDIKETTSYKEAVFGKEGEKSHVSVQWKEAAKLHTALDRKGLMSYSLKQMGANTGNTPFTISSKEIKFGDLSRKSTEIQYKTLTTDSNYSGAQTTYWDALDNYEQTPAELNDVYAPVIISQLNEMTTTYNLLPKVDMSGDSAIRFRVKTARPTADGSVTYGSTPGWDSRAQRRKINVAFTTYRQDIAVEFEEIELARASGGIGDVYSEEIKDGTESMMNAINSDILTSATTPAEGEPYTFETTIKTSGTLYGRDLSTFTNMQAASVTNAASAPLTLERMRTMIDDSKANGATAAELVFICHYTQSRKFKTLIQNIQRTVPTSARVGFEGRPELDGVPVFEDYQANTDDLWMISLKHTKFGMKKAPTYVEFGLTQMRRQGVVWQMGNLFCTKPSHNAWTYGLKTT